MSEPKPKEETGDSRTAEAQQGQPKHSKGHSRHSQTGANSSGKAGLLDRQAATIGKQRKKRKAEQKCNKKKETRATKF